VPLFGIELFFTRDLRILSNVAAGALAPGVTYTPPSSSTPQQPLTLAGASPSIVARGETLTLSGTGFSATASNNAVIFTTAAGTVEAAPGTASATSLAVTV